MFLLARIIILPVQINHNINANMGRENKVPQTRHPIQAQIVLLLGINHFIPFGNEAVWPPALPKKLTL
jgi:hypothetical protein